jgi:hypothetical protein
MSATESEKGGTASASEEVETRKKSRPSRRVRALRAKEQSDKKAGKDVKSKIRNDLDPDKGVASDPSKVSIVTKGVVPDPDNSAFDLLDAMTNRVSKPPSPEYVKLFDAAVKGLVPLDYDLFVLHGTPGTNDYEDLGWISSQLFPKWFQWEFADNTFHELVVTHINALVRAGKWKVKIMLGDMTDRAMQMLSQTLNVGAIDVPYAIYNSTLLKRKANNHYKKDSAFSGIYSRRMNRIKITWETVLGDRTKTSPEEFWNEDLIKQILTLEGQWFLFAPPGSMKTTIIKRILATIKGVTFDPEMELSDVV